MAELNTVGTSRNRRIPGIARLERGRLWRWGGSEAIQSALQTSDDVFVPLGLGEQMVPILSFLLAFLTASIPVVNKLASLSPVPLTQWSSLLRLCGRFRATLATPAFPKCLSGWETGQTDGSLPTSTRSPHSPRPSLCSTPLICSVPAPLNFLRSPLEMGEGRPLQINLTETESPRSSHTRSHSQDRCPPSVQTCLPVHTHVAPGRAGSNLIYVSICVTGLVHKLGLPATHSPASLHRRPLPCGFLKDTQKCSRRHPDSRQPLPALPGRFAGLGGPWLAAGGARSDWPAPSGLPLCPAPTPPLLPSLLPSLLLPSCVCVCIRRTRGSGCIRGNLQASASRSSDRSSFLQPLTQSALRCSHTERVTFSVNHRSSRNMIGKRPRKVLYLIFGWQHLGWFVFQALHN